MKTGLRTEIVVSVVLLIGAALMFAGFLLVKLAERELLGQHRESLQQMTMVLSRAIAVQPDLSRSSAELFEQRSVLSALGNHPAVIGWQLLDARGNLVAGSQLASVEEKRPLSAARLAAEETSEVLRYATDWNPFSKSAENYLELTVPLDGSTHNGLLRVRYSLTSVSDRVKLAQRLVLVYVVLYGCILSIFGIYLLNRNVVRPVRELQEATGAVADGNLEPVPVPAGPGEIHELAGRFNHMVEALRRSRAETEMHIATLEETNRALEQARDEVVRSEKMATVGHIAAGMAHEIGNPLAAVIGYLNVLLQDLADPAEREILERTLSETQRIDQLVRELLDYATPKQGQGESFNPVAVLGEAIEMLSHQGALERVQIDQTQLNCDVTVLGHRGRLLQVFVNLLLNARDAMPEGGRIQLSSSRDELGIALAINDQGDGVTGEDLERIFEPFYTTKDPGKGRGLGLAVCQRIVEELGGRLRVQSTVKEGSTFTVWLPAEQGSER